MPLPAVEWRGGFQYFHFSYTLGKLSIQESHSVFIFANIRIRYPPSAFEVPPQWYFPATPKYAGDERPRLRAS